MLERRDEGGEGGEGGREWKHTLRLSNHGVVSGSDCSSPSYASNRVRQQLGWRIVQHAIGGGAADDSLANAHSHFPAG